MFSTREFRLLLAVLVCSMVNGASSLSAQVPAARFDVNPSGASADEHPRAEVVTQSSLAGFWASSGNRGDWSIRLGAGDEKNKPPVLLSQGVLMASLNELLPATVRGGVEVAGRLTTGGAVDNKVEPAWVAGFTSADGREANVDFAAAWFSFADGWIGAHVAADSTMLASNLPDGTTIRRLTSGRRAGEIRLDVPGYNPNNALLFAIAAENGDNTVAVGPTEDGTSWYVRVADESQDFQDEENSAWSFVLVPLSVKGLIGGRVTREGNVARGSGEFIVRHVSAGKYELFIPGQQGVTGQQGDEGVLLAIVDRSTPNAGVEDNTLAWKYDPKACGGRGGIVVETYDMPSFANQDTSFAFVFLPYDNSLAPKREGKSTVPEITAADSWAQTLLELSQAASGHPLPYRSAPLVGETSRKVSLPLPPNWKRLWLLAETTGAKPPAALCEGGRFVVADGSVQSLADLRPLYKGADHGKVKLASVTNGRPDVLSARGGWAIAVEIPKGAVRFEAILGTTKAAADATGIRFRVTDRPSHLSWWSDVASLALEERFSDLCRQFARRCGDISLAPPDWETWAPKVRVAVGSMTKELGPVAVRAPDPAGDAPVAELLASFAQLVELKQAETDAIEQIWKTDSRLAELLDFPDYGTDELRARLRRIAESKLVPPGELAARIALIDKCQTQLDQSIVASVDGKRDAYKLVPKATRQLEQVSEWIDRQVGWPTYGGDLHRSFVSRERIDVAHLGIMWRHTPAAAPSPAWPPPAEVNYDVEHRLSAAVTYDRAYHTVAAQGCVVYGSSASDAIVCLDAASGRRRWLFPTEGPVRLAPTIAYGRVYAGCDDGVVYCLDLKSGQERWRLRASDKDRRLVGNGRIISEMPVRAGISVADGKVYFAVGLFPQMGVFLCAADAHSGKLLEKKPIKYSPQGYTLLSDQQLYVPTGRTPFVVFRRDSFKPVSLLGKSDSWGRDLPGGSCALIVREGVITGPGEGGAFHAFAARTREAMVKTQGRRIIVDGMKVYVLQSRRVEAVQRRKYLSSENTQYIRLWQAPCRDGYCMLKTASHLVVGGQEQLLFFDIETGKLLHHVPLPGGRIEGLAAAEGRLFASCADGSIYCLGPAGNSKMTLAEVTDRAEQRSENAARQAEPSGKDTDLAERVIDWSGFSQGRALVVGDAQSASMAVALARGSNLRVTLAIADPKAAQQARQRVSEMRMLGTHVEVHSWQREAIPYRPYTFNLVIVTGTPQMDFQSVVRVVRPSGGVLLAERTLAGAGGDQPSGQLLEPPSKQFQFGFRRNAVAGAGAWTDTYVNAQGTVCTQDAMPFGKFRVLWFGRPGPRRMFDRHWKASPPLYRDGMLYVVGRDWLAGMDAYNGTIRWEKTISGAGRVAVLRDCGTMSIDDDNRLYVATANECIVLDGPKGKEVARLPVTQYTSEGNHWGFVSLTSDRLIGSATLAGAEMSIERQEDYTAVWRNNQPVVTSRSLFGADRISHQPAWKYVPAAGVIANPTLTVLQDRVCFVESMNPATKKHATGRITLSELWAVDKPQAVALDSRDGHVLWRTPLDLAPAAVNAVYLQGSQDVLVLTGTRLAKIGGRTLVQYRLIALGANNGRVLWQHDNTPSHADRIDGGHGEQTQHPVIVGDVVYGPGFAYMLRTGQEYTGWLWNKSPQCAPLAASAKIAFSRQDGHPTAEEFATGKRQPLTFVSRPACYLNILPVGGIVLIPEGSSGCTCGYSIQTSMAFYPEAVAKPESNDAVQTE